MPVLNQQVVGVKTPNNYHFTATKISDLGSNEYTLVSIICDVSSSVSRFRNELEACIRAVRESCERSSRSDNLLLRLCRFNSRLSEVHGFRELVTIDPDEYRDFLETSGCTALYEAAFEGIDATATYGKTLCTRGLSANAIVFVITDGQDNASKRCPDHIRQLCTRIWSEEQLESLVTVLVGVNTDHSVGNYLTDFRDKAGIDHYIDMGQATPDSLAKLAAFMSRSISLTSVSLGTGQASVPLTI